MWIVRRDADIAALVAEAEVEACNVVRQALAASGLREKAPRGGPGGDRAVKLNRGLQSQPLWGLVPSLPWLVAQEEIAREARARAQAVHRGSIEAVLSGGGAAPGVPPPEGSPSSYSEASQHACPVLGARLADATARWQAARGQLLNTCAAARPLQYNAIKAGELMRIRARSTRSFFLTVTRKSQTPNGFGIPLVRDPENGGGLAASLRRNAAIRRDHFAKLGIVPLTTNVNEAVIWRAQRQSSGCRRRMQPRGRLNSKRAEAWCSWCALLSTRCAVVLTPTPVHRRALISGKIRMGNHWMLSQRISD